MKNKLPAPANDDPLYMRTCNTCYTVYGWRSACCPQCGCQEFSVNKEAILENENRRKCQKST